MRGLDFWDHVLGAVGAVAYPPRNPCGRLPDAVVAERGCRSNFGRNEHLDVEARLQ